MVQSNIIVVNCTRLRLWGSERRTGVHLALALILTP